MQHIYMQQLKKYVDKVGREGPRPKWDGTDMRPVLSMVIVTDDGGYVTYLIRVDFIDSGGVVCGTDCIGSYHLRDGALGFADMMAVAQHWAMPLRVCDHESGWDYWELEYSRKDSDSG